MELSNEWMDLHLKDTASGFQKFRGERLAVDTSLPGYYWEDYASINPVAGTKKNFISFSETIINGGDTTGFNSFSYHAMVADSLKERMSERLCDEWRDKIVQVMPAGFTVMKYKRNPGNPGKYGWIVRQKLLNISITTLPATVQNLNCIWITISYDGYKTK